MKKAIIMSVGAVLGIEIIFIFAIVYSGFVDVSAAKQETGVVRWLLATARDRSVETLARGIPIPSLDDSVLVMKGFDHYSEMCVTCHGAPGHEPDEIAKGLNPPAPVLSQLSSSRNAAETFLIIKNGIKMTAMPAWGPTHDDSAIWGMVAFVRRLPQLTAEQYKEMQKAGHNEEMGDMEHHDHR